MAEQSYLKLGLVALVAAALGLSACSTSDATTGSVVTDFDSASTAERFRTSGAREMTLKAFCRQPPASPSPTGSEAIQLSCSGRVLAKAGNARVFDKGNGLYHVVFPQPVRNGDICDPGTNPQSLCGHFSAGDKMRASRIDAS
jgi:hypothetical protein